MSNNNYWSKNGIVSFDVNLFNLLDNELINIINILKDILNKTTNLQDRLDLYDQHKFVIFYDNNNYPEKYKPFIYYGLRKYSILTNFFIKDNNIASTINKDAIDRFINLFNLEKKVNNRGLDLLLNIVALDILHKYIIEYTAIHLNISNKTELNTIIHDILANDKTLYIKNQDIYEKILDAFFNETIEINNKTYNLDPLGFTKLLEYIYGNNFNYEILYFVKENNNIYVIDNYGTKKIVDDIYFKSNINIIPDNTLIPSPYFYLYYVIPKQYFNNLYTYLRLINNNTQRYPITLLNKTFELTIQELFYLLALILFKLLYEIIFSKTIKFKRNNEITEQEDLYNYLRNLQLSTLTNNNITTGEFNIAGLYQIIINLLNDELILLINNAGINEYNKLILYMMFILQTHFTEAPHFNSYSKETIFNLASYILDVPYRLLLNIIIQKIEFIDKDIINIYDKISAIKTINYFKSEFNISDKYTLCTNYNIYQYLTPLLQMKNLYIQNINMLIQYNNNIITQLNSYLLSNSINHNINTFIYDNTSPNINFINIIQYHYKYFRNDNIINLDNNINNNLQLNSFYYTTEIFDNYSIQTNNNCVYKYSVPRLCNACLLEIKFNQLNCINNNDQNICYNNNKQYIYQQYNIIDFTNINQITNNTIINITNQNQLQLQCLEENINFPTCVSQNTNIIHITNDSNINIHN